MSLAVEVTGVRELKNFLAKYDAKARCLELARRLCEVGEPTIRQTHGNHAHIEIKDFDNGYVLQAEGKDILFIEFGTGDKAGDEAALYDEVPASVAPGTWSEGHAQMYSKYGFWIFGGVRYESTDPHPAFYYAYQAMVDALPQIAQEVFAA